MTARARSCYPDASSRKLQLPPRDFRSRRHQEANPSYARRRGGGGALYPDDMRNRCSPFQIPAGHAPFQGLNRLQDRVNPAR